MNYFNPADVCQLSATFNYIAKSGVGFALTPENDQVFITARDVERLNIQVGDGLRIWAVDNHRSPDTSHYPSRWRTVRIEIVQRIEDVFTKSQPAAPAPAPVAPPMPAPAPVQVDFVAVMDSVFSNNSPWTVNELTHAIAKLSPPLSAQPDLLQRVATRLNSLHKTGDAACLKVFSKADNDRASAVYYAKSVDVFYDHLDTPIDDDL